MRHPLLLLAWVAASLSLAPAAPAVNFVWVTVGDPGNACEQQVSGCFGGVGYPYRIATHEVTNAQYVEFLNAKAASDPLGLYNPNMASSPGGITRSGIDGSYTYSIIPGRESKPVNRVSYFDALRFANWLHNGQGDGDTETGAYTLLGGTPEPSNPLVQRNPEATIWVATDAEWYKASYYDTVAGIYYDYPTGTDVEVVCSIPTVMPNTANCANVFGSFTEAGSYPGSPSPNGTFDQAGNASEWVDGDVGVLENRIIRGGAYISSPDRISSRLIFEYDDPWIELAWVGFRIATLAEGPGGTVCGDAICEGAEDPITCPADCPDVCGDGICSGNEDPLTCSPDCPDVCGDGLCTGGEDPLSCSVDCADVCGDGLCTGSEDTTTCVPDCGTLCGDGVCNGGEDEASCPEDCAAACIADGAGLGCDVSTPCCSGVGNCTGGKPANRVCAPTASVCGDGVVEGAEECEAGVPLADTCTSLGFSGGTLACNTSTCIYDTSGCTGGSCLPAKAACSVSNDCCSGNCKKGECRGN